VYQVSNYYIMPISFDLDELRQRYDCKVYLETGMWDPRGEVSLRKALRCSFDKVYCIELRDDWVALGNQVFNEDVQCNRLRIIHDDSVNLYKHIGSNPDFSQRSMFFLDAHVDNSNIQNYQKKCPLFDELEAIKQISRNDNIIMVDDLRIITQPFPWGETIYGNIDFLKVIKEKILEINPEYKFMYLDGQIPNDVLLAYI